VNQKMDAGGDRPARSGELCAQKRTGEGANDVRTKEKNTGDENRDNQKQR